MATRVSPEGKAAIDVSSYDFSTQIVVATEKQIKTIFGRHTDLIAQEIIDQITRREVAVSLQEFGDSILSRREDYFTNRGIGITAYLTELGGRKAIELSHRFGHPIPDDQIRPITDIMWELKLPLGGFVASGGAVQFFQEVSSRWTQEGGASKPFYIDYDRVVRVESTLNEVWQNWNYNWDGTPKPEQP